MNFNFLYFQLDFAYLPVSMRILLSLETCFLNENLKLSRHRFFVVRNSNLVQKMSPRRFLSFSPQHSNQTLVFIIHSTACKGNIRNNRRDLP